MVMAGKKRFKGTAQVEARRNGGPRVSEGRREERELEEEDKSLTRSLTAGGKDEMRKERLFLPCWTVLLYELDA